MKGEDKDGTFEVQRRYSDFDKLRSILVLRWPGCFISPLPPKQVSLFIYLKKNFFLTKFISFFHIAFFFNGQS